MIQARTVADDSPAGYFRDNATDYQPQCDNDVSACIIPMYGYTASFLLLLQTAATHTTRTDKDYVVLTWVAPPAGTGAIIFRCLTTCLFHMLFYAYIYRYAFVMNYSTYWANLCTDPIEEGTYTVNQ